jgi:hypothetical protein
VCVCTLCVDSACGDVCEFEIHLVDYFSHSYVMILGKLLFFFDFYS